MEKHSTSDNKQVVTIWKLKIGDNEVDMHTINHTVKLGKYLMGFGVPVNIIKRMITLQQKENGKAMVVTKEEEVDCTDMLKQDVHEN